MHTTLARALLRGLFGVLLLQLATITVAHAQATRTWVSGVGDDVNPCSRTAPCKTFAGAISKTAAGGIINCLDPGGFGTLTATKSITLDCTGTFGSMLSSGVQGLIVNGSGITVYVRGLSIEGAGTTLGVNGINFINGAALHISNSHIHQFSNAGILFQPAAGTSAKLFVSDTEISDNGNAATNGGILIAPVGTGVASANLQRVVVTNNTEGVRAVSVSGGNTIRVAVADSMVAGNSNNGIHMVANGGVAAAVSVHQTSVDGNGGVGIQVDNAGGFLLLSNSMVTSNTAGGVQTSGGSLLSIKNSMVNGNVVGDGTTTALTPQ